MSTTVAVLLCDFVLKFIASQKPNKKMTDFITNLLFNNTTRINITQTLLPDIPPGENILMVTTYHNNQHSITTAKIVYFNDDTYHLHFADNSYGVYTLDSHHRPQLHKTATHPAAPELSHTTFYRIIEP